MSLSGGNQQKTLLAKWLCAEPKLLIADEPTRGVDVGAKAKIHKDLRALAESGVGVIVISSELPEILGLCDRVAVIDHGRLAALDTPAALIRGLGAEHRVVFTTDVPVDPGPFKALPGVSRVEPLGDRTIVYGRDDRMVVEVVNALSLNRIKFRDLRTEQADLEDVFLALTGREMRD